MDELLPPIPLTLTERWLRMVNAKIIAWSSWDAALQLGWLALAALMGWLATRQLHLLFAKIRQHQRIGKNSFLMGGMQLVERVTLPVLTLLSLMPYTALADFVTLDTHLLDSISSLLVGWIVIRSVTGFIRSEGVARAVSIFILLIAALNMFGLLDATIKAMDSLAFTVGKARISLFTVTKASITLIALLWLATLVTRLIEKIIQRSSDSLSSATQELLAKIVRIVFYSIATLMGLQLAGVDLTVFAVALGALGVGIGFGLQKITSNFISGIILLFERTISRNDLIEIGGTTGWVRYVGIRHTMIEVADGREVLIPNEDFVTQRVTNWTYTDTHARIEFKITLGYEVDAEQIRRIVLQVIAAHPRAQKEPAPACHLREFSADGLVFQVFFWIKNVRDGTLTPQSEVMIQLLAELRKAGIEIPIAPRATPKT